VISFFLPDELFPFVSAIVDKDPTPSNLRQYPKFFSPMVSRIPAHLPRHQFVHLRPLARELRSQPFATRGLSCLARMLPFALPAEIQLPRILSEKPPNSSSITSSPPKSHN
jgi:hypothetical protein